MQVVASSDTEAHIMEIPDMATLHLQYKKGGVGTHLPLHWIIWLG